MLVGRQEGHPVYKKNLVPAISNECSLEGIRRTRGPTWTDLRINSLVKQKAAVVGGTSSLCIGSPHKTVGFSAYTAAIRNSASDIRYSRAISRRRPYQARRVQQIAPVDEAAGGWAGVWWRGDVMRRASVTRPAAAAAQALKPPPPTTSTTTLFMRREVVVVFLARPQRGAANRHRRLLACPL